MSLYTIKSILSFMNLLETKEGKLKSGIINTAILVIILLVVLFSIYAELIPEAQSAGSAMNDSNRCIAAGCFPNTNHSTFTCINDSALNATEVGECANRINPIPLSGLVNGTGVVFIVIMAALFILVIKGFLKSKK